MKSKFYASEIDPKDQYGLVSFSVDLEKSEFIASCDGIIIKFASTNEAKRVFTDSFFLSHDRNRFFLSCIQKVKSEISNAVSNCIKSMNTLALIEVVLKFPHYFRDNESKNLSEDLIRWINENEMEDEFINFLRLKKYLDTKLYIHPS